MSALSKWLNIALGFFYPEACQICGRQSATPTEGFVCQSCRQAVPFIQPPFCMRCGLPYDGEFTTAFWCQNCREMELHFTSARSAVAARGTVLEAIHRYKYHRALWFEPFLADLLVHQAVPEINHERWDWIVPVPLHSTKHREREFNQAERMALHLGKAAHIPVRTGWLKRVLPTKTQTLLTRPQRAANMRHAFVFKGRQRLDRQRVVLVDDVFTTGATTSACARVLRSAGAAEVCVWTVARGL